jgi:hypothetical protein
MNGICKIYYPQAQELEQQRSSTLRSTQREGVQLLGQKITHHQILNMLLFGECLHRGEGGNTQCRLPRGGPLEAQQIDLQDADLQSVRPSACCHGRNQ